MKFAICNLGCKVNNYEANWYRQELSKKYEEVPFGQAADIYIINSCTVTNTAGSKSRQMLHRARKLNPDAVICMVSCYVQMEYGEAGIFDDADILVGTEHKKEVPSLIEEFIENRQKVSLVAPVNECPFEEMVLQDYNQTRAYLKIQDGCNQFCSYCTIPLARGRERSLQADKVIENARLLTESGHKELVLTGIHTGRYNDGQTGFTDLVRRLLDEVTGLERIRISSIEVTEITDGLLEMMREDERVTRHLHIPLQAGSDSVLKAMRRPYTKKEYLQAIEHIRSYVPDVSISTDVIVGFPQESEQEFEECRAFISECCFSFLHVFPYAAKKHTVACSMKGQVREEEKRRRVGELTVLSEGLYNDYIENFPGRKGQVIFEKEVNGYWQGHNSEYVMVRVRSDEDLHNQIKMVRYLQSREDFLEGELI
ncbi:MAG: tRNA (N(6)-L-threonylcarbamoyladenosine(37)-C(2))-methylthiotransferase MtaB [Erysipelotrichaceae bacterium]|nr:tRNA (N(6)-L-threonylcarbamoyladenosine(37)-C(2))-methylthiotransferase MtaB [Erysipelotrichaceae bacterium]